MLGELENQFSLTRAALRMRCAQKQIPISGQTLEHAFIRLGRSVEEVKASLALE